MYSSFDYLPLSGQVNGLIITLGFVFLGPSTMSKEKLSRNDFVWVSHKPALA